MKERQHLLEFLYMLIECPYLSDLHQKILHPEIHRILGFLDSEDFSLKEWTEACDYILEEKNHDFSSSQEAFDYLSKSLSGKRSWRWHE